MVVGRCTMDVSSDGMAMGPLWRHAGVSCRRSLARLRLSGELELPEPPLTLTLALTGIYGDECRTRQVLYVWYIPCGPWV